MNIQAYIQALKTNTNAKVITNPRLVVVNNKEAIIQIIEEIPYNSNTSTGIGTGVTSTSISFKEVGIKLKVLPQINRDGTIILDVAPEQSTLIGFVSGAPEVDTSKTNTTFMLQNGETAVIGGLVKENETKNESGIPLLCDIPIIGNLFKNTHKSKERTELTVLITAKILK
jgi:type II secretory pathway component GspD/PulD (secretin)